MSQRWKGSITLVGAKLPKTVINYDLQVDEGQTVDLQFDEAQAALSAITVALEAVTDANVIASTLKYDTVQSGALGSGDTTDEAAVVTYLNGVGQLPKYHTLRIPAPIAALFLPGDPNRVDESNADLINYVATVAAESFVSDGEVINTAIDNGIDEGYWRSRSRTVR